MPIFCFSFGQDQHFMQTPFQIIHIIGNFLRIWSIHFLYRYLSETGASVVLFLFTCLIPASTLFIIMQKPWKGRPLSNTQVVPSIINGGITALYFILWGKGLKSCGPLKYSAAVLRVPSGVLYGRRGHVWKKVGLLQWWHLSTSCLKDGPWNHILHSMSSLIESVVLSLLYRIVCFIVVPSFPFVFPLLSCFVYFQHNDCVLTEKVLGIKEMALPISAGILSALRRVIARCVSLKNQPKGRLNAITIASATCFLFPVAMWDMIIGSPSSTSDKVSFSTWAFLSTILFGVILIFYVDSIAEERYISQLSMQFWPIYLELLDYQLLLVVYMNISYTLRLISNAPNAFNGSWRMHNHYGVVYKMDFSFPGFLICCLILGFGIYEATSLERGRKDYFRTSDPSNGMLGEGPNSDVFTSNLIYVCIWITSCNCELMYTSSKFVGSKLLDKCWSISQMLENQNQEEGNILVAKH
ncbi:unnamed protein product [Malus baccata var. baccata]